VGHIVFFDSGIGGLTVLQEALVRLPQERYIYFADMRNVPYGIKSKEQVHRCIMDAVESLVDEDTQALVVACNTATSIAITDLRSRYRFPVIGMEPAVKPAVEMNRESGRKVLVLATPLTLREAKYHQLVQRVDDHAIVDSLPMPGLVTLSESLQFSADAVYPYLTEAFAGIQWEDYSTIVLGCSHFPYFRKLLASYLPPHLQLIDGSRGTVSRLRELLSLEERTVDRQRNIPEELLRVQFRTSGTDPGYLERMKLAYAWYAGGQSTALIPGGH
jgi:glutamate racemase